MPLIDTPRHRVTLQSVWTVENAADAPLTDAVLARLAPYLTRYGETMNVRVHAVGGVANHVHLLYDLPPDLTASKITEELQRASERFINGTLRVAGFAWEAGVYTVSISPERIPAVIAYIAEQDERHTHGDIDETLEGPGATDNTPAASETDDTPAWLREALGRDKSSP